MVVDLARRGVRPVPHQTSDIRMSPDAFGGAAPSVPADASAAPTYIGLPTPLHAGVTQTKHFFQALDNFTRVFAIRPLSLIHI